MIATLATLAALVGCLGDALPAPCPLNARPDPVLVSLLLHVEATEQVPVEASGLLLAAACLESGLRRDPGAGDHGRALGVLQLHGWAGRGVRAIQRELAAQGRAIPKGDARLDVEASARFWVRHWLARVPAAARDCPGSVLASAEATAVRAPRCLRRAPGGTCLRYGARCAETSHWRLLRAWREGRPVSSLAVQP